MKRALAVLLMLTALGCTLFADRITDISQKNGYSGVVGKEFKTLQISVLYKINKSEKDIELGKLGTEETPTLEEIPQTLPAEIKGSWVLGVLPSGSTFRLEKVLYTQSFEHSYVRYKATITSPGPFQGLEVDPTWLAEVVTYPKVPKFDPSYVEELTPAEGK